MRLAGERRTNILRTRSNGCSWSEGRTFRTCRWPGRYWRPGNSRRRSRWIGRSRRLLRCAGLLRWTGCDHVRWHLRKTGYRRSLRRRRAGLLNWRARRGFRSLARCGALGQSSGRTTGRILHAGRSGHAEARTGWLCRQGLPGPGRRSCRRGRSGGRRGRGKGRTRGRTGWRRARR